MNFKNTQQVNATMLAQAVQLEDLAKFYRAEAEKADTVAKTLRELAKPEGQSNDPKVEPIKVETSLSALRVASEGNVGVAPRTTRPTVEESRQIAGSDQSFDRIAHNG